MLNEKRVVTKIEPNPLLSRQQNENSLLRVAAYCRVSTDSEDQIDSYKAQVAYYTDTIAKNPKWRFAGIYADEGITGTQATKRVNFMRMIRDCEKGKINLILTKSVARFARNTVDSLNYLRKLKAMGIGVFFEEQNLDSLKLDSEMLIGFHSVLAQAESENISANVRWGIQQRMKSGTFKFRYNILGYRRDENGEPEINEEEAVHIRNMFQMYLDGKSLEQIKYYLETNKVLTKTGNTNWSKSIIKSMLTNERYCGNLLMQKTFTENCITKKVKKNRGEMAKYLIINNHPAIISESTFKLVQMEMSRRSGMPKKSDNALTLHGKYSGKYAFTDMLVCGECGSPYRRKTWSRNGVRRRVWRCLTRMEHGTTLCPNSITVEEEPLKQAICRGISKAIENKKDVMDLIYANLAYAITGHDDTLEIYAIEQQLKRLDQLMEDTVSIASSTTGDIQRLEQEIKSISEQMVALRERLSLIQSQIAANEKVNAEIKTIKELLASDHADFTEFSDTNIRRMAEYIRVMKEGKIIIRLKGGVQIEENIY